MKTIAPEILLALVLAITVLMPRGMQAAGPAPVDLGACAPFTILGATAVSTDGGEGIITGDVGLSPAGGASITALTATQVHGTIYAVDAAGPAGSVMAPALLSEAQSNLTTAYLDTAGRSSNQITKAGNIGGSTLAQGLYWSASSLQITGDLILDAGGDSNAVWIFQMGSTLTTAAGPGNSRVILAGGAQARNIFWQVGSDATLGTYSIFKGTILALGSITMGVGAITEGRALARTGAVTFNGSGSVSLPILEAPSFTRISRTNSISATVVVSTTPYFQLTLEACPDLLLTNWTVLTTDTPVVPLWTNTDYTATVAVTQRFYRATLNP